MPTKIDGEKVIQERIQATAYKTIQEISTFDELIELFGEGELIPCLIAEIRKLRSALHDAEAIGDFPDELRNRFVLKEAAEASVQLMKDLEEERNKTLSPTQLKEIAFAMSKGIR